MHWNLFNCFENGRKEKKIKSLWSGSALRMPSLSLAPVDACQRFSPSLLLSVTGVFVVSIFGIL